MGIPTRLTLYLESLHSLETAECILYASSHDMVDTGHTVCRRRSLEEYERGRTLTLGHASCKEVFLIPLAQHLLVYLREVELTVYRKFLFHFIYLFYPFSFNLAKLLKKMANTKNEAKNE